MDVNVYPKDYTPFRVFAEAPYNCIILISDRCEGSTIYVHTHVAGLLLLKEQIDSVLNSLNNSNQISNRQQMEEKK